MTSTQEMLHSMTGASGRAMNSFKQRFAKQQTTKFRKLTQEECLNFKSPKTNKKLSCAVMRNKVKYSIYKMIPWTEVKREEVMSTILGEENALDEV